MEQTHSYPASAWQTLPTPFQNLIDATDVITGSVSGRDTDIREIIVGTQHAIILAGAPLIGKSVFIRYLQRFPQQKSWRNELMHLPEQIDPNKIHFTQLDLTPTADTKSLSDLHSHFLRQCKNALQAVGLDGQETSTDLIELNNLLRKASRTTPNSRYFVMIDKLEQLGNFASHFHIESGAHTLQEYGLALLDRSGIMHTLVDLIDNSSFGVIIAIQSLPRLNMGDRLIYVSADLARFTTMTLQAFTWRNASKFVSQTPEDFGETWAKHFRDLGGKTIFSEAEQEWLCEQAGMHPYLLHQCCIEAFRLKQQYASLHGTWPELHDDVHKNQLIDQIHNSLNTFFPAIWKRLQEVIDKANNETQNQFYKFAASLAHCSGKDVIPPSIWQALGTELQYILSNEGIVRSDPFQPVHYPGALLCQYFAQKGQEYSPPMVRGFWLTIEAPGNQRERISLSELEYLLLKTLKQHPKRCTEEELIKGAWGKPIEHATFTQRIHHLRKKLRDKTGGIEVIENHYGGQYSLNYPDWLQLE